MLTGLNRIYNVQEDRGYVFTRLLSLVYTFLFLLVLLLTLALPCLASPSLGFCPRATTPAMLLLLRVISSRFFGAASPADGAVYRHVYVSPQPAETSSSPSCLVRPGLPWGGSCFLTFLPVVEHFSNFSTDTAACLR